MKKFITLFALALSLVSCTAEPIEISKPQTQEEYIESIKTEPKLNTFTVKWNSNQGGSYVEFTKHVFKDCKIVSTVSEIHRENEFEITLESNQKFEIQIFHTEKQKYPELYLSIYKGNILQYVNTIFSNVFMLISFVDKDGNINQY